MCGSCHFSTSCFLGIPNRWYGSQHSCEEWFNYFGFKHFYCSYLFPPCTPILCYTPSWTDVLQFENSLLWRLFLSLLFLTFSFQAFFWAHLCSDFSVVFSPLPSSSSFLLCAFNLWGFNIFVFLLLLGICPHMRSTLSITCLDIVIIPMISTQVDIYSAYDWFCYIVCSLTFSW